MVAVERDSTPGGPALGGRPSVRVILFVKGRRRLAGWPLQQCASTARCNHMGPCSAADQGFCCFFE